MICTLTVFHDGIKWLTIGPFGLKKKAMNSSVHIAFITDLIHTLYKHSFW